MIHNKQILEILFIDLFSIIDTGTIKMCVRQVIPSFGGHGIDGNEKLIGWP